MVFLLALTTTTPRLATASPYSAGYLHGCGDGKVGFHKYLNTPGNGIDYQTFEFMQGYDKGYKSCFIPNGIEIACFFILKRDEPEEELTVFKVSLTKY